MEYSNTVVSVVMITYGHEDYIAEAIEGVLMQQTDFQIELIIANDCSPDDTNKIIETFISNHPKSYLIKYIKHTSNIGMHANFFFAINECKGEYIAFCEGDDYWTDIDKLQSQYNIFQKDNDVGVVHTNYDVFYQKNSKLSKEVNLQKNISTGYIYEYLIRDNFIATLTCMIRKDFLSKIMQQLENLSKEMPMIDYPLWLYFALDYKIEYINKSMACYRYLENSASHSIDVNKQIKFENSLFEIRNFFIKNVAPVPIKIEKLILTNHKYNQLAHLSKMKGKRAEFLSTFLSFHKNNRSIKHLIGSFFYSFKKIIK